MSSADVRQADFDRGQALALIAGVVGLAASVGAGVLWPGAFFPAYLVGYLFWVGIALGSISLLMLHNLTGGQWGLTIRRPLEAAAMTILPMAVLFVPIALGLRWIYPWMDPDIVARNPAIKHKQAYLNETAFLIRAVIYFAYWVLMAILLHAGAIRRDAAGRPTRANWLPRISGPGLAFLFFTGSFAAIDWGMSIEPAWYSTIYGPMVIVGWGLLTFASMILIAALLARISPEYREAATPARIQDNGNLMLAFVMLWAYMSFSQFLIIWAGNLVEEIPWYLRRTRGGWGAVALALVVFHFFVPFFALFFLETKRNVERLMVVAGLIVFMHLVDLTWMILPGTAAPAGTAPRIPWASVAHVPVVAAGLGGVSVWTFLWHLRRRPLVPEELVISPPDREVDSRT